MSAYQTSRKHWDVPRAFGRPRTLLTQSRHRNTADTKQAARLSGCVLYGQLEHGPHAHIVHTPVRLLMAAYLDGKTKRHIPRLGTGGPSAFDCVPRGRTDVMLSRALGLDNH